MKWVWKSLDYNFEVTPTGEEHLGSDGRIYSKVITADGETSFVPKDELVDIDDEKI